MKKILVLAFVSAAFFFGCSADSDDFPSVTAPEWSGTPTKPDPGTEPSESEKYCSIGGYCVTIDEDFTARECLSIYGTITNSCQD